MNNSITPKELFLERIHNEVELHLQEVIAQFQNLPEHLLLRPSSTSGWSIAQCLAHLNSYGHYYLPLIKKAIANAPQNSGILNDKHSWLGKYFTKTMRADATQKKYKAFKGHIPATHLNAYAEIAEFINQNEQLLLFLKQARYIDTNGIKINISISKWIKINLNDLFDFMVAHNNRHLLQAKRNL
ncbi:MAG: DinB family protein [Bacteroidota bacterium]